MSEKVSKKVSEKTPKKILGKVSEKVHTTVLCIGDPHIQTTNITEIDDFVSKTIDLIQEKTPDFIVIMGDVLHTHERLHTTPLNKAYEVVDKLRKKCRVYILVGNHDYINNQQFLTQNHWMCAMKEWDGVHIIDHVTCVTTDTEKFVFVPYVPPGRFQEALETLGESWEDASCIFAHQEFYGCKMGVVVSIEGDKWGLDNPFVISGHIHSRQTPQPNIYYVGSALQHAYGESESNILALVTFHGDGCHTTEEIDLELPRKKIVYMDVEDFDTYEIPDTRDSIKLTLSGNYEQFKTLKNTKKYKDILKKNIKIVFKPRKITDIQRNTPETQVACYGQLLEYLVYTRKDRYLTKAYEFVVNNKDIETDDIMFLE